MRRNCNKSDVSTEYLLDGSRITSLASFYNEADRALGLPAGDTPNLDWLDDMLSGGLGGIPDDGIVLRWVHSEHSRGQLGNPLFERIRKMLQRNSNVRLRLE